jgi:CRISPR/Cas system-associated exonuclease Cas4 (RecB family)
MTSVLKMVNLSFIGEPLSGLQMMGMLETRCLDFDNIIITSFNEGIFPKSDIGNSLIPYSIRKPYGLPTTDHQDAIFSYNFYRLIKRASNVWLIYDTRNNNDNSTGEVSRFVKQLEYLYNVSIDKKQVTHTPQICKSGDIIIEKSEEDIADINKYLQEIGLTPSALNEYIKCPLKFYYTYIKGIREQSEIATTLDSAQLGSVFHAVMELIYTPYKGKQVTSKDLSKYTRDKIEELTHKAVIFILYDLKDIKDVEKYSYQISGENKILFEIIVEMVVNMLECDKKRTPFTHISNENKYTKEYTTSQGHNIKLKGFIDKIDEKDNSVHLIDYKTTKLNDNIDATKVINTNELKAFFYQPNNKKYVKEILQMCFYNLLYKDQTNKDIETYLFLARMSFDHDNFLTNTQVLLPENWEETFREELDIIVDDLMNKEKNICQTSNNKNCEYCYFAPMCRREKGD